MSSFFERLAIGHIVDFEGGLELGPHNHADRFADGESAHGVAEMHKTTKPKLSFDEVNAGPQLVSEEI